MRPRLFRYAKDNAIAFLALFVALGGTGAYAANTIFSSDIVDGEVKSVDIGNNEIGSADVKDNTINTFDVHSFLGVDVVDGTLTADDLAPGSVGSSEILNQGLTAVDLGSNILWNVQRNIGVVPANSCVKHPVNLTTAIAGDHMILTANSSDAAANLSYTAEFEPAGSDAMEIKVCNPTTSAIDDGITHVSLLSINEG
jgi:hypothetical protein